MIREPRRSRAMYRPNLSCSGAVQIWWASRLCLAGSEGLLLEEGEVLAGRPVGMDIVAIRGEHSWGGHA